MELLRTGTAKKNYKVSLEHLLDIELGCLGAGDTAPAQCESTCSAGKVASPGGVHGESRC